MKPLDAQSLHGLWAALPTPWNAHGSLEVGALSRNVDRLAEAHVDGIYTTDSDGEFYAIELDEFTRLAGAFAKAMRHRTIDAAMGVTWCHTQGIIDRIKASLDAGIPNVHVAFPFFMPLANDDVDRFFEDLCRAAPDARWVHYAHPRCAPVLNGMDYAHLLGLFPDQLIGTKLGTTDLTCLAEILIHSPKLSHSVVDPTMFPGMLLGARGCCSYWCNTLPHWQRRYMDACINGDWHFAKECHLKLLRFELDHITPLRRDGHLHGIISKARASLSGFLEESGLTRAPYSPVAPAALSRLQDAFDLCWSTELEIESFDSKPTEGPKR